MVLVDDRVCMVGEAGTSRIESSLVDLGMYVRRAGLRGCERLGCRSQVQTSSQGEEIL